MLARSIRILNILTIAAALIGAAGVVYFLSTYPISFQKTMSLTDSPIPAPDWKLPEALDARRVVGAIPYHGSEGLREVLPKRLYERTILEGYGNCANKTRGLSYFLDQEGIPFERIDLIPVDGYLQGKGHTLVRTKYVLDGTTRIGLIDMLEGGVPTIDGVPVDLPEFSKTPPYVLRLKPLNVLVDDHSDYYGSFLDTVCIGVVDHREISRYFRFVEIIYIDLNNTGLERFFCNASAVMLGIFPQLHVSPEDFKKLRESAKGTFFIAHALTWSARLLPFLIGLSLVLRVVRRVVRRSERIDSTDAAQVLAPNS